MHSAPPDAESIARAARAEPMQYTPKFSVKVEPDPDAQQLEVICDAAGFLGAEAARAPKAAARAGSPPGAGLEAALTLWA